MPAELSAENFAKMWDDFHAWAERLELVRVPYAGAFDDHEEWSGFLFRHPYDGGRKSLLQFMVEQRFGLKTYTEKAGFGLIGYPRDAGDDRDAGDVQGKKERPGATLLLCSERNFALCAREMERLARAEVRLKVLLAYPEKEDNLRLLLACFAEIIGRYDMVNIKNKETESMLICGRKKEGTVRWSKHVFNTFGRLKRTEPYE